MMSVFNRISSVYVDRHSTKLSTVRPLGGRSFGNTSRSYTL